MNSNSTVLISITTGYITEMGGFFKKGSCASATNVELKVQQIQRDIETERSQKDNWKTIANEKLHFDAEQCPCCKTGKMQTILALKHMHYPRCG